MFVHDEIRAYKCYYSRRLNGPLGLFTHQAHCGNYVRRIAGNKHQLCMHFRVESVCNNSTCLES